MLQVETETEILTSLNFESETKTGVAIYKSTANSEQQKQGMLWCKIMRKYLKRERLNHVNIFLDILLDTRQEI